MASGSDRASNEPTLADLNADYVSAFLRDLEVTPTKRYPQGSPFRSRAACKSLKRLANWLAEERVLAQREEIRVLRRRFPGFRIFHGTEADILADLGRSS